MLRVFSETFNSFEVPGFRDIEKLSKVANKAGDLADGRQEAMLAKSLRGSLAPQIPEMRQFCRTATDLAVGLDPVGKPGQRQKAEATQLIVKASTFFNLQFGTYNDEHLAELLQNIRGGDGRRDFSGDDIRKRRIRFKNTYPARHAIVMETLRRHRV